MGIGRLVIPMNHHQKKTVKFVLKHRVWKLKDEETSRLFGTYGKSLLHVGPCYEH